MANFLQFFKKPWLYLIIILFGTCYKIYFLDNKYFWIDEIYTIQQTAGLSLDEFSAQFPENEIKSINFYHDKLHLNETGIKWKDQIKGMANAPNFTPSHYVFLTIWQRVWGDDYMDYRVFSILCYFLSLIFIFWFCRSLFRSKLTAWIVVSIFAVSPYLHIFIQEARYYILWIAIIFLLNYLYLKVLNERNKKWLLFYIIIGIISLYTSIFSGFIILGHLIHLIIFNKKSIKAFLLSLTIIGLFYAPWFYTILIDQTYNALTWQIDWKESQAFWEPLAWQIFGYTHAFFNIESHIWGAQIILGGDYDQEFIYSFILATLATILLIFSFRDLIKNQDKRTWSLILLTMIPTILFFCFADWIRNSYISPTWRYSIINMVMVILVVGAFLARSISREKIQHLLIYLGIISLCIYSLTIVTNNKCWYSFQDVCNPNLEEASLLDSEERPLVITENEHWMGILSFLSMVVESKSNNIDILRLNKDYSGLKELIDPELYSNIHVYWSSNKLKRTLRSSFPDIDIDTGPIPEEKKITFVLNTSELTDSSKIYITGSHENLGNWNPSQVVMTQEESNIWTKTISCDEAIDLEYKFTLGSWETEALNNDKIALANFKHKVSKDTTLYFEVLNWGEK